MEDDRSQETHAGTFSTKQQLFVRYFTAILVDLVVLNLFDEYWGSVAIESFAISLLAAIVLQVLLKTTMALEHYVGERVKKKSHRLLSAWGILFVSKIAILEVVDLTFGNKVLFLGAIHGLVAFIVVVLTMLVAELMITKLYKALP